MAYTMTFAEPDFNDDSRRAALGQDCQRDGGHEDNAQLRIIFDNNGGITIVQDCSTNVGLTKTLASAELRAGEAMDFFAAYPTAYLDAKRYATDCVREGKPIETHLLVAAIKNNNRTGCLSLDNNHMPFIRRLLVADDAFLAANMEFRKSMFDLLDIDKYVLMLHNHLDMIGCPHC